MDQQHRAGSRKWMNIHNAQSKRGGGNSSPGWKKRVHRKPVPQPPFISPLPMGYQRRQQGVSGRLSQKPLLQALPKLPLLRSQRQEFVLSHAFTFHSPVRFSEVRIGGWVGRQSQVRWVDSQGLTLRQVTKHRRLQRYTNAPRLASKS